MAQIYQRFKDSFFTEFDLIPAWEEDEILLSYVIPRALADASHQWLWLGGRCYFGRA